MKNEQEKIYEVTVRYPKEWVEEKTIVRSTEDDEGWVAWEYGKDFEGGQEVEAREISEQELQKLLEREGRWFNVECYVAGNHEKTYSMPLFGLSETMVINEFYDVLKSKPDVWISQVTELCPPAKTRMAVFEEFFKLTTVSNIKTEVTI